MKKKYQIFFAIPFDAAIKNQYQKISKTIIKNFPDYHITAIWGNSEIVPSKPHPNISLFKAQNKDLVSLFKELIIDADIVIADLTNNNPNVHFELGIAFMQNKNILRVTGRSVTELGFDIRNHEIFPYLNQKDLLNKIINYLDTFFKIKRLEFSDKQSGIYFADNETRNLEGLRNGYNDLLAIYPDDGYQIKMRDGKIKVEFELINARTDSDWFGIYFRISGNPLMTSHLLYTRANGSVEICRYPGIVENTVLLKAESLTGMQTLIIEFENNFLMGTLNNQYFEYDKLTNLSVGFISIAAWRSKVKVKSIEILSRDTIEW